MNLNKISYEWLVGFRNSTPESVASGTDWYVWAQFRGGNAPTIIRIYMHVAVQAKVMVEYESN
jgi:hypothetical protein